MLNRGCEQIKWKMEMIYAAEKEKKLTSQLSTVTN